MVPVALLQYTLRGTGIWSLTGECLREMRDIGQHPFKAVDVTADNHVTRCHDGEEAAGTEYAITHIGM